MKCISQYVLCFVLFIFFICKTNSALAFQINVFQQPDSVKKTKVIKDTTIVKKRFGRSARMWTLGELIPFTFDRYITKEDYAKITFKSTAHNINPGSWEWDADAFQTNQIGHPYHGSLFFNAFRSNGHNFWQSVPASFAGSYIWETFAENQAPSPNDFINTGLGGIILGEVTHRLSNKVLNNHSRGFGRQASEVLAFVINPMNGLSRIINGNWGKRASGITEVDSSNLNAEFDVGLRKFNVNIKSPLSNNRYGIYGRIKLNYGLPNQNFKKPFTNFYILLEMGQDDTSKINMISVYGSLIGWQVKSKNTRHLIILSANYDYMNNEAFYYSGQSIKMNLFSEYKVMGKTRFTTSLGLGGIVLAAIPNTYVYNNRNYDYGPGISINGGGQLSVENKFTLSINYRGGWMKTVNGNNSDYFIHGLTNNASLKIIPHFFINGEYGYFNLHGNYDHLPDVNKTYPYVRFSLRYATGL